MSMWGEWTKDIEYPGRRAHFYQEASKEFLERLEAAHSSGEEPEPEPEEPVVSVEHVSCDVTARFQFDPIASSGPLWRPQANIILSEVARQTSLEPDNITGPRRFTEMVFARQILMWRLWRELDWNCGRIGRFVGNRDRTTVLYGVRKIEAMHKAGTLQPALDKLYGGQG